MLKLVFLCFYIDLLLSRIAYDWRSDSNFSLGDPDVQQQSSSCVGEPILIPLQVICFHRRLRVVSIWIQGCKPDTNRLTERAAAASQAWIALREPDAMLICSGYASQAGKTVAFCKTVPQHIDTRYRTTLQDFQQRPIFLQPKLCQQESHSQVWSSKTRLRIPSRML